MDPYRHPSPSQASADRYDRTSPDDRVEARRGPGLATEMIPVAFDGHAGALHRPKGGAGSGITLVVSPPVGREGCCVYRHFVEWADGLAGHGLTVLRYDPRGEADSLPGETDDQWACWRAGAESAVRFARLHTEAHHVALAGLRLGATLAMAAAQTVEVDSLLLLAPVLTGAAYLGQLRLSAAVQNVTAEPGGLAVDGLRLSPATLAALGAVDCSRFKPRWRRVFIAGPDPGRAFDAALGPEVTRIPFHNLNRLFRDTHLSEAPARVFAEAAAWLDAAAPGPRPARLRPRDDRPPPAALATPAWTEERLRFGDGLRGVLCRPARASAPKAVIFGNTGADPRASSGGFTTDACRALASAGFAALRFDFLGLGESAPRQDGPTHVYASSHVAEFRAAAALLAQYGYHDVTLVGTCTGGFHAVRAVIEEPAFRRVLAFNCWLVWRPGTPLGFRAVRMRDVLHSNSWSSRFRRLVRGELNPLEKASGMAHRLKQLGSAVWGDAASRAVQAELQRACGAGKRFHVVLGRTDQAVTDLEADFGRHFGRLSRIEGLSIRTVPDLDHGLQSTRSRSLAIDEILRIVGSRAEAA